MKKRIGSKIYDTESSELIYRSEIGSVYRKKSRDREWFWLTNNNTIEPLEDNQALTMIGDSYRFPYHKPEPQEYRIRVDQETYASIAAKAKDQHISMAEVVRRLCSYL